MQNYIDKEKLDKVVNHILLEAKKQKISTENINQNDKKFTSFSHEIYDFMLKTYGLKGMPAVLNDKKYQNLISKEFYRGVRDIKHHANLLCDNDCHSGVGTANGLYASSKKCDVAHTYTNNHFSAITTPDMAERVLSFKLSQDARICDINKLQKQIDYCCDLPFTCEDVYELEEYLSSQDQLISMIFHKDLSKMAIALNYDALEFRLNGIMTILNRAKICVSQSEFDRIVALSHRKTTDDPSDDNEK